MQVERILKNEIVVLMGRIDEGKTHALCCIIEEYKKKYAGNVVVYGMRPELITKLDATPIYSLLELEEVRNSIIIVDEVGRLFDLENRKNRRAVDDTLRLVVHNGNKIVLSGLPSDFKKFLCAKAKMFIYKSLMLGELINGCLAKEILGQYTGPEKGKLTFLVEKDEMLCYDGHFWKEKFSYKPCYDTKKDNINLFEEKKQK